MKELVGAIHKVLCCNRVFIQRVKLQMVLSKRSLIHSDSFQPKI
jgi:hypothetical protein